LRDFYNEAVTRDFRPSVLLLVKDVLQCTFDI